MTLQNKTTNIKDAISSITDGSSIFIGGFGIPGTPFCLIDELVKNGAKELTIIKNDANENGQGIDLLLQNGQVKKLITSHIGLNSNAIEMMNEKKITVEFVPQGILAERIRAAGAGLMGIVTDIGIDTKLAENKIKVNINETEYLFEPALKADFAFIHAAVSDTFGNLIYEKSSRNFNPLMAMATKTCIVESEEIKELGELDPNEVHTPGPFVDKIVYLEKLTKDYDVFKR
ncbi:MAG: CoA transferase subunit A [Sulfurospirillaceae bacterium]|nr:CoA transferase subunit A [Sulfurospirillaceae bacterium]